MNRYDVEFSPRALSSLRETTRYIMQYSGTRRASEWLTRIMRSTDTLKTHPYALRIVGDFEGEDVHARVVTVIDVVHAAHGAERDRYEPPCVRERESARGQVVPL